MKRSTGLWFGTGVGLVMLAVGCAQPNVGTPTGSGGSGSSTGGSTGTGGSSSTGGSTGTGGSPGTGGSQTGGSVGSTGGVTGTGGSATGGSTGTGGMAGHVGNTGGSTGTGGNSSTGGSTGTGGASATGGSGGGGMDINTLVPGFDGYYWEGTCSGNVTATGRNCPFYANNVTTCASGSSWDNSGTIKSQTLTVAGTAGQSYTINFEVRGIVGTRCYTGGTAPTGSLAANATPNASGFNNTWYVGGKQYNNSIWNTYEIHVSAPSGKPTVYYANAFGTDTVNTSWCQKEATYQIKYTASITVVGGSTITFTVHDTNCQAQQNCGSDDSSTVCNAMKTVDLSDMSPPGTFAQPPTNNVSGKAYYPQWLYFDVKSVTSP